MGQRSRKRGRRERPPGTAPARAGEARTPAARAGEAGQAAPGQAGQAAPGQAGHAAPGQAPVPSPRPAPIASRYEARNAAARAALAPYAEGERPWPIIVSAILATLFGAYNLVSLLLGANLRVGGHKPGTAGVLLFALVMFVCAGGMWRMRYWAVLGFQALLVFTLLLLSLLLIKVSNLAGLAVCLVGLSVGGTLFFKLVKAMGRMQVPVRERR